MFTIKRRHIHTRISSSFIDSFLAFGKDSKMEWGTFYKRKEALDSSEKGHFLNKIRRRSSAPTGSVAPCFWL